jgi:hypothetical protein
VHNFANGSNQTSLRDYEYNGRLWRVQNELFWLSKAEIVAMAVKHGNMAVQIDTDGDEERFVWRWLKQNEGIAGQARNDVLSLATELLEKSFSLRQTYNTLHPRYCLNAWDAGWLQVYKMIFSNDRINDSLKGEQTEFKRRLNALEKKIYEAAREDGMI